MKPSGKPPTIDDCIGPLGPFLPEQKLKLPEDTRREVLIEEHRVMEIDSRSKIVAQWDYTKRGMG